MNKKNRQSSNFEELWSKYHANFNNENERDYRNKLIVVYFPFLEKVCNFVHLKLFPFIELDDLKSYGVFGLIKSIEGYNETKGNFKSYARPKIIGAIKDELRELDFVPRIVRLRTNQLKQASHKLEKQINKTPSEEELIEELSKDIYSSDPDNPQKPLKTIKDRKKAELIIKESRNIKKISYVENLDEVGYIENEKNENPRTELEKKDLIKFLQQESTREEKLILNLYHRTFYWMENKEKKGVPMGTIAKVLGYKSAGSIGTKYKKILERLNSKLIGRGFDLEYCLENL
jgi:RNA polymerase sigma factor (sigma-70 family)